jgi:hypothetical protein
MFVPPRKRVIAGVTALVAAIAPACSNSDPSGRAGLSLARNDEAAAIQDQTDARMPQAGLARNAPAQWGTKIEPHRLPVAPRTERAPVRRYAAMPRFKPHARHVRQDEQACLAGGYVQETQFIRPTAPVGRGQCALQNPFVMTAATAGRVRFEPAARVRCQMIPSIERWVSEVLQPGARAYLGSRIVGLKIAASYACRPRNSQRGARLSEHGRGNAIDISAFHLADGRTVTVKAGWRGPRDEGRFLRYVHRGACEHFSTVLGPKADRHHHDHLHFDLASHGRRGTYRVCK